MSDTAGLRLSDLRDIAKRDLANTLDKIPGSKVVAIDPSLYNGLKLLDTPKTIFTKEKGINGLFVINETVGGDRDRYGAGTLVILMRPSIDVTKLAAAMIERFKKTESRSPIAVRIYFVPKLSLLCSHYLVEGAPELRSCIDKLELDFFTFDEDLLSMELPHAFRDLFVDGDVTSLSVIANALVRFQAIAGRIPKVRAKGYFASKLVTILKRLDQEVGEDVLATGASASGADQPPSRVSELYILDRGVDLYTPMMTQLTYEGLIDELYGIDGADFNSPFEFGAPTVPIAASQSGGAGAAAAAPLAQLGEKAIRLTSADRVLDDIRDVHSAQAGTILHQKSLSVKAFYDKKKELQQLKDIKDYMRSLPQVQETHRLTMIHASICSNMNKVSKTAPFRKSVQMEHEIILQADSTTVDYVDELIHRNEPLNKVLRLLCLMSLVNQGLKPKVYEQVRESLMLSYGIPQIMSAFYNLERVGLLTRQSGGLLAAAGLVGPLAQLTQANRPIFANMRKNCRLWVDDLNERMPDDIAYVYSGYAPLMLRVLEDMIKMWDAPPGVKSFALDGVPGERAQLSYDVEVAGGGSAAGQTVMVLVIGGITRAEIAAIRMILSGGGTGGSGAGSSVAPGAAAAAGDAGAAGRPAGGGPQDAVARRKFIIATTNITSGRRLINSLLPFDV